MFLQKNAFLKSFPLLFRAHVLYYKQTMRPRGRSASVRVEKENKGVLEQHEHQKTHQKRDVDLRNRSARLVDSRRSHQRVAGHVLSADVGRRRQRRAVLPEDGGHFPRPYHSRRYFVYLPYLRRRHRPADRVSVRPQQEPERPPHSVHETRGDPVRRDRSARVLRAG